MPAVRARFAVIVVVITLVGLGALATESADAAPAPARHRSQVPTVVVNATDFAFDAPASIKAGTVKIVVEQHGSEPHQAGLVKLKGKATGPDWLAALAKSFDDASKLGTFVPGPNTSSPGHHSAVTVDLHAGRYLIVCLIPSPDGTPHVVKGMMRDLTVTGKERRVHLPKTRTVKLTEYHFLAPKHLHAGETVTVENRGGETHEMVVVRLKPGKTVKDLLQWDRPVFQPEPFPQPYEDVTGTTVMAPADSARLQLPRHRGRYLLVCFIPNARDRAHFTLGMLHPITLR